MTKTDHPMPAGQELLDTFTKAAAFNTINTIVNGWDMVPGESEVLRAMRQLKAISDEVALAKCQIAKEEGPQQGENRETPAASIETPVPASHVFVGMFRPPWEQFIAGKMANYDRLQSEFNPATSNPNWDHYRDRQDYQDGTRQRWLRGEYDTGVYKTIAEVVKARRSKEKPATEPDKPAIPDGSFQRAKFGSIEVGMLGCPCGHRGFNVGELIDNKAKIAIQCRKCGRVGQLYK